MRAGGLKFPFWSFFFFSFSSFFKTNPSTLDFFQGPFSSRRGPNGFCSWTWGFADPFPFWFVEKCISPGLGFWGRWIGGFGFLFLFMFTCPSQPKFFSKKFPNCFPWGGLFVVAFRFRGEKPHPVSPFSPPRVVSYLVHIPNPWFFLVLSL